MGGKHSREPRRNIATSRLSLALIVGALVVVAGVVWRSPWGSGTSPTDSLREAGEPLAGQAASSAEATLAEIAEITDDFSRNASMYSLADGATREQVEEWLAEVETLPPSPHRYDLARVLYIRFAVLDPEAALDHAFRGATKPAWLEAIFRTWAQLDPDAAIARAAELDSSAKAAASRALLQLGLPLLELRSVAERLDEPEYLDWYRRTEAVDGVAPPTPTMRVLAEVEARGLARRDGESHADAWNRAIRVEHTHVRQVLAEQVALDWAVEDPHAALAALDLLAVDDRVATSGDPFGSSWHVGPMRMLIRDRIGPLRDRAAAAMMFDVARHDARLAERLFDGIETPAERAKAAKTLHWHFSNTDPNPRRAAHYRKYLPASNGDTS